MYVSDGDSDDAPDATPDRTETIVTRGRGRGRGGGRGGRGGGGRGGRGRRGRGRGGRARQPVQPLVVDPGWQRNEDVEPPRIHAFKEPTGPAELLPSNATPLTFLKHVLGADFFVNLAEASNLNAVAKSPPAEIDPAEPYATSDTNWKPTTGEEMEAFIGINVAMGLKDMPEYKDYWSTDPVLNDHYISGVMSRHRYEKISQYLHVTKPGEEDPTDKLTKVRPLITLCQQQFRRCFHPSCDLSVDEAMIRFDGRLSWKQYMPKKPVKWGIKLWCLCDANTG